MSMNEQQMETIERLFPDGFLLMVPHPNGVQVYAHNPKDNAQILTYRVWLTLMNDTVGVLMKARGHDEEGRKR
jgi:hypothetical protein